MSERTPPIAVLGAGAIGCYIGGCLAAAGADVILVGRARVAEELDRYGLTLSDWQGRSQQLAPDGLAFEISPEALSQASIILVTVKSGDTATAAHDIATFAPKNALVVSLQNGVRNADVLKASLPGHQVLQGMVPFNVAGDGAGHFHCGTEGQLALQQGDGQERGLIDALTQAGLQPKTYPDMQPVAWGKLLMNLNNPINALSGIPLRDQLGQRGYRRILAASIREALAVLKVADIAPARTGKVIPALLPYVLLLPDSLFRRAAAAMLKIDPQARSSMADDLRRGRRTEVDFLNGEVVRLARMVGTDAPVNRQIQTLIHQAEEQAQGSPGLSSQALARLLLMS